MFSFFRQKKQNDVRDCIQRILNRTAPRTQVLQDLRVEPRYQRSVAIVLIPWNEEPLVDQAAFALVQDLSDYGARMIAQQPIEASEYVCCFALDEMRYLRGEVRRARPLGGGFWQCGINFLETIMPGEHLQLEELQPMYDSLSPSDEAMAVIA
jgi:hypothetical protein